MLNDLTSAVKSYIDTQDRPNPYVTAVPGLILLRSDHPKQPAHLLYKPALCIVVRGAKWAIFGNKRLDYRAGEALVVSVEMPAFGAVAEASEDEPYLGVIIEFDLSVMREVHESLNLEGSKASLTAGGEKKCGVFVAGFDGPLADCALRMVRLLGTPQAIPVLYPGVMREICYWLLSGPQGAAIMQMTTAKSHTRSVITAIHALRDRLAQPVRIAELAAATQLSPSAFHRHFKAITSLSPLQYQKQLRLLEARRLLVAEEANVETAAFQVGYESASQFSREYLRMFGMPPRQDAVMLRTLPDRLTE